jgi:hypothetical protein
MNHALKDIGKQELQKLLDDGFIYPILNSEWVSPLVIVPKKWEMEDMCGLQGTKKRYKKRSFLSTFH